MPEKTMIDASGPNAGRVYDYLLGGHHNFEVDRRVGDQVKTIFPFLPKAMRLFRWCLQDVARTLTVERGFDTIVDFASGLPTVDHLHTAVAPGTTVIYSDRDPITVEYGREILSDTPNAYYFQADCRWPEELLNRSEVQEILGDNRHLAFVSWGITMYLSDAEIAHMARFLYDWSGEGSCWACNLVSGDPEDPAVAKVNEMFTRMGDDVYLRPLETFKELIKPWHPDELGFRSMAMWHGIELDMREEDFKAFGAGDPGHGAYLVK